MEHANCLQCGELIHAEDGGLCARCTAQVHEPEPAAAEIRRCPGCGEPAVYSVTCGRWECWLSILRASGCSGGNTGVRWSVP